MKNFKKKSNKMNKEKLIQFYNSDGVKKVFDIHRYSDKGILYFLRKNEVKEALI
jgi:hypothetical protein|tara:strand:+ start:476 stop:637 length:162 start_codon:yes stop_codon:yes gene_type:complete